MLEYVGAYEWVLILQLQRKNNWGKSEKNKLKPFLWDSTFVLHIQGNDLEAGDKTQEE